ncbi:MAG: helix-turn-helix transcriptional regulator [Anaerovoracaceae bacterium]
MSDITKHVGSRIKKYRKSKNLTIDEFSTMINKSKATLSKYENGSITMDIDTLLEIGNALEIDFKELIDYQAEYNKSLIVKKSSFFNQRKFYLYYYDGRTNKIVRCLFLLGQSDVSNNFLDVTFYQGLASYDNLDKCQHLFSGRLSPFDTISHFSLVNQINPTEWIYICTLNPMHINSPAVGIMSGISSSPFFAPISVKVVISKDMLDEDDPSFRDLIHLGKDDVKMLKASNMLVINRPPSMSLKTK